MSEPTKHPARGHDPASLQTPPAADRAGAGDPAAGHANPAGGVEGVGDPTMALGDAGLAEVFAKELAEARRAADENWDKYLRAEADLENYRKRAERLREEAVNRTRRDLLLRVLDVADNLQRALAYESLDDAQLRPGVEGTLRQLERLMQLEGVAPIVAENEAFDPTVHEALAVVEVPDLDAERVVKVERPGYLLNGELLRPARVVIGRPPELGD